MRAALLLCVLALAACGEDEPPNLPSPVTGVIVAIEGSGSDVRSFTLERGFDRWEIHVAPDVDYGFDLAHLHDHRETGDPVRLELEEREGRPYALRIDDAEAGQ